MLVYPRIDARIGTRMGTRVGTRIGTRLGIVIAFQAWDPAGRYFRT